MKELTDIKIDRYLCDLCGTCVAVCPEDCIDLTETQLNIDFRKCTLCTLCIQVCPVEALEGVNGRAL